MNVATSAGKRNVGVRDLRDHLSRYLIEVREGGELVVTEHGHPIARIVPAAAAPDRLAELIASGTAKSPQSKRRRLPAALKGVGTLSDLVAAQRR
jgi:prevent-host-death family protein